MATKQSLRPDDRLRRRADYLACYRRGRRVASPLALVYSLANGRPGARLGITASRKVGQATVRNRLRRRVREVYRRWPERASLPSVDLVVHLQPAAAAADFSLLRSELERILRRLMPREGGR